MKITKYLCDSGFYHMKISRELDELLVMRVNSLVRGKRETRWMVLVARCRVARKQLINSQETGNLRIFRNVEGLNLNFSL